MASADERGEGPAIGYMAAAALCEALGLGDREVTKIVLECDVDGIFTVYVKLCGTAEHVRRVAEVLRQGRPDVKVVGDVKVTDDCHVVTVAAPIMAVASEPMSECQRSYVGEKVLEDWTANRP